jgi:thiamine pyrophosphate-dependent acetolactate synthase large subunit-like protein
MKHYCKNTCLIESGKDLVKTLEEMWGTAFHDRQGPVWIDIPKDVQCAA